MLRSFSRPCVYTRIHTWKSSLAHIMFKVSLLISTKRPSEWWWWEPVSTFTVRGQAPNWHKASLAYLIPLLSPSTTINLNPIDVFCNWSTIQNQNISNIFTILQLHPSLMGTFLADSSYVWYMDFVFGSTQWGATFGSTKWVANTIPDRDLLLRAIRCWWHFKDWVKLWKT